jgi:hypothetical protein
MDGAAFASWLAAAAVAASGVWLAERANPGAAWWLVTLILLSVLVFRPGGVAQLTVLMQRVFGAQTPR